MEVEYVLTVEDYVALNRYHLKAQMKPKRRMGWLWLVLLVILLGLVLLPTFFADPKQQPAPVDKAGRAGGDIAFYITIPAIILVVALVWWNNRYRVPQQVRRLVTDPENQKRLLGLRRTSIGPEGLAVRGEEVQTQIAWTGIRRIVRTQDHAFFYITTLEAIIIPRRPFADGEAFEKFIGTANSYWEQAEDAEPEAKSTHRKAAPEPDTNITPDERADH